MQCKSTAAARCWQVGGALLHKERTGGTAERRLVFGNCSYHCAVFWKGKNKRTKEKSKEKRNCMLHCPVYVAALPHHNLEVEAVATSCMVLDRATLERVCCASLQSTYVQKKKRDWVLSFLDYVGVLQFY